MQSNVISELKNEIEAIVVQDDRSFLRYLAIAGRLAALEDDTLLKAWRTVSESFKDKASSIICDRCRQLFKDFDNTHGKELANAIIETQDYFCFRKREYDNLPESVNTMLEALFEESELVSLDEEAVEALEDFIEQFPIPEDDRMIVVDSPLSDFAKSFLASRVRELPIVTAEWDWAVPSGLNEPEVIQMEGPPPSPELIQFFKSKTTVNLPNAGTVEIYRQLTDEWEVNIDLRQGESLPPVVDRVRIGLLPGKRFDSEEREQWVVSLRYFPVATPIQILGFVTHVCFRDGYRVCISCPQPATTRRHPLFGQLLAQPVTEPYGLAADAAAISPESTSEDKIFEKILSVENMDDVTVQIRPSANALQPNFEWEIYIIGSDLVINQYERIIVSFPNELVSLEAEIDYDVALVAFDVQAAELFRTCEGNISIYLVDKQGSRHKILCD